MQGKAHATEPIRCRNLEDAVRQFEALRAAGERATLERSSDGWIVHRVDRDE